MRDWIKTEVHDNWFEIIFNRPDKRNAIQIGLLEDMAEAVGIAERTPNMRLIVLRGEGKSFSAGLDILAMGGNAEVMGEDWTQRPHETTRHWQAQVTRLTESTLPVLALIHGHCLGAGMEIALACDFRVAAPNLKMSLEETRVGIIPDVGGTTRLTQLVGATRAKELILTSRRIDAETADRWGILNDIVPHEEFEATAQKWADEISRCAPLAVSAAKRTIQGVLNETPGLNLEAIEQAPLFHTEDLQIAMGSVLQRATPEWKWR